MRIPHAGAQEMAGGVRHGRIPRGVRDGVFAQGVARAHLPAVRQVARHAKFIEAAGLPVEWQGHRPARLGDHDRLQAGPVGPVDICLDVPLRGGPEGIAGDDDLRKREVGAGGLAGEHRREFRRAGDSEVGARLVGQAERMLRRGLPAQAEIIAEVRPAAVEPVDAEGPHTAEDDPAAQVDLEVIERDSTTDGKGVTDLPGEDGVDGGVGFLVLGCELEEGVGKRLVAVVPVSGEPERGVDAETDGPFRAGRREGIVQLRQQLRLGLQGGSLPRQRGAVIGVELDEIGRGRNLLALDLGQARRIVINGGRVIGRRDESIAARGGKSVLEPHLRARGVEGERSQGEETGADAEEQVGATMRGKSGARHGIQVLEGRWITRSGSSG